MGSAFGWHIGMRLADDRVLAGTTRERRLLCRVVLRQGERAGLLAYGAADTHLHAALLCERDALGPFVRSVGRGLAAEIGHGVPLHTSFARPIASQWHGMSVLRYVLTQARHHGIDGDPFCEASSLPDLLGLRVVAPYMGELLARRFPRVRREELAEALAFEPGWVVEDPCLLVDAAAAALALPDLGGRGADTVLGRRAAVHAAGRDVTAATIAEWLGTGERTIQRWRAEPCDARLLAAVRAQWWLRSAHRQRELERAVVRERERERAFTRERERERAFTREGERRRERDRDRHQGREFMREGGRAQAREGERHLPRERGREARDAHELATIIDVDAPPPCALWLPASPADGREQQRKRSPGALALPPRTGSTTSARKGRFEP